MASMSVSVLHVTVFLLMLSAVSPERMKNKIYDSIEGTAACFRRLNGTHQFGCTSHRLGNVGIVHIIENISDQNWLLEKGKAVPYMVVLNPEMFTKEVVLKLKNSGKVNGIALINNGSYPETFTHEDTCPNRYSGLSSLYNQTCDAENSKPVWNPEGTKLLMMDLGFPIFYIQNDYEKIEKCYNNFNSGGRNENHDTSLCAMEMNSFMFATVDSATCIRRSKLITNFNPMKFCDPLGGRNVWSTLFPRRKNVTEQNSTVYVVASRMDTSSLFDGVAPGATSPVTGMVTLLTTAHILSLMTKDLQKLQQHNKNVLFVLFNGESFDYIGSSRMVWDMKKGRFPSEDDKAVPEQPPPLRLEHLAYFVELSHITNHFKVNNTPNLVFHFTEKNSVQSHLSAESFMEAMETAGKDLGLNFDRGQDGNLPPASLQEFIAHGNSVLPGVVIAGYNTSFMTRHYHSVYDESKSIDYEYRDGGEISSQSIQSFVANVSIALAKTLYTMVTDGHYNASIEDDVITHLVDDLFHCYLDKMNCSLFQKASSNMVLSEEPATLYVGVSTWRGPNYHVTTLTGQTLAYLTGEHLSNQSESDCQNDPRQQIFQYIWMKGEESGVCVKTTMNFSVASSPAFEVPDYDWSSGNYSTWTESIWQELSIRVFLKPSRHHEIKVFSIGAVVFGLSFIIVYFLNARSHIIFGNTLGTGAC